MKVAIALVSFSRNSAWFEVLFHGSVSEIEIQMSTTQHSIIAADLSLPLHQQAVVDLINGYAADPMGRGEPLSEEVLKNMVPGLRAQPMARVLLAFEGELPIGIAICFLGFSTFAAKPLLNIHDLAVREGYRGRGVGRRLLAAIEALARQNGCCKITMEVQEKNDPARILYESIGYAQVVHHPTTGGALFMSKSLG